MRSWQARCGLRFGADPSGSGRRTQPFQSRTICAGLTTGAIDIEQGIQFDGYALNATWAATVKPPALFCATGSWLASNRHHVGGSAPLGVAAAAILIAASSNNPVKGIYAYSMSGRKTGVLSLSLLASPGGGARAAAVVGAVTRNAMLPTGVRRCASAPGRRPLEVEDHQPHLGKS